jgi:threonine/homoserine/homoserine lactone efflux protein
LQISAKTLQQRKQIQRSARHIQRMTYDLIIALVGFAFVMTATPGPNNLMLMTSGANFGYRRTIPHMLGIAIGFTIMLITIGMGIVQVFESFPLAYDVLTGVSVAFLIYLAWKIATATPPRQTDSKTRPMTLLQAALFQWVNPKAWAMALSAITIYAPSHDFTAIALVGIVFGLINLPVVSSWTLLGQQMRRFLTNRIRLRVFNGAMAALLLLTLYPFLAEIEITRSI